MDFVYEKIAGTGASRNYNLMKCRRELEKSCSNYKSRASHCPPAPQTTPTSNNAPTQQQAPLRKDEKFLFHTCQETGHTSRKATKSSFQYTERDIQHRSTRLKSESTNAPRTRFYSGPISNFDPFDGYTGSSFSNDFSIDDATAERVRDTHTRYYAPRKHSSTHRYVPTHAESIAIRQTAALIARHCAVRDKEPYMNSPPQEALHCIRLAVWQARADAQSSRSTEQSPEAKQDDNGVRVTEDGCIIQRGFDVSPLNSSPTSSFHVRCDSACAIRCKTPNHISPKQDMPLEPIRSSVRNGKGARIPVCFRKREISDLPTVSTLSALVSGPVHTTSRAAEQDATPPVQLQTQESQQKRRMPASARTALVFSGSFSSNAVASDSEYDSETSKGEDDDEQEDGAMVSVLCADGVKEHGSIANLVQVNKPAEIVKASNRPSKPSAPPSPPSSKIPLSSSRRASQAQQPRAGTLLPHCLSKLPNPVQLDTPVATPPRTFARLPPQQQLPKPQFPRSQQTAKLFAAHRQQRRPQEPLPPRARSPCLALGLRCPVQPCGFSQTDKTVSALLAKIEKNLGRRPPNFKWDHIAPMHGFSSCRPFYVLD